MQGDSDMEDYGFEYSDEDYIEEDVDIENQYYNSKGISFCFNLFRYQSVVIFTRFVLLCFAQGWWRTTNCRKHWMGLSRF